MNSQQQLSIPAAVLSTPSKTAKKAKAHLCISEKGGDDSAAPRLQWDTVEGQHQAAASAPVGLDAAAARSKTGGGGVRSTATRKSRCAVLECSSKGSRDVAFETSRRCDSREQNVTRTQTRTQPATFQKTCDMSGCGADVTERAVTMSTSPGRRITTRTRDTCRNSYLQLRHGGFHRLTVSVMSGVL